MRLQTICYTLCKHTTTGSTASPHPAAVPSSPIPPASTDITTKLAALNLGTPNSSNNDMPVPNANETPDEDDDMLPASVATKFLGSTVTPNSLLSSYLLRDFWSTVYWVWKHPQKTAAATVLRKFEELCEKQRRSEKELWEEKLKAAKDLWEAKLASSENLCEAKLASSENLWEQKIASSENALKAEKKAHRNVIESLEAEKKAHRNVIESHTNSMQAYRAVNMVLHEQVAYLKSAWQASKSVYHYIGGRSVTRADAWNSEPVKSLLCPELAPTHALTAAEEGDVAKLVNELMGEPENKEGTYYKFILNGLSPLLPGCSIINSSKKHYSLGESPDISIRIQGVRQAHRLATHGIIEVKSRKHDVDTAQWLGQVKDYRKPGHRADSPYHLLKYGPLSWVQMIHYIRGVTNTPNMGCKPLPFSPTLGLAEELIGGSDKWRIGRFTVPEKPDSDMVVKVSLRKAGHYHIQELKILRHLKGCMDISSNITNGICKLVWDPARKLGKNECLFNDIDQTPRVQFGLTPAGRTLRLDAFKKMDGFRKCISGLLDALQWLHQTAGVIHRDIRVANVVLNRSTPTPVLIDFDCAIQLPASSDTTYSGGLICVPERVVEGAIKESLPVSDVTYNPRIEDDYCALVLLVLELVFPKKYQTFPKKRVNTDGNRSCLAALSRLHKNLAVNPTWGHLWDKAKRGAISELHDLASVALWIEEA
ncbi:hypothetical protein BGX38DRAFT_1206292 [Terfezia claveryi]|nr:hypothetical protein BGX38DRAFT_1206292 [Terfezia claveryi]